MRKAVVIGTGLFLTILIVRAPASLLTAFLPEAAPIRLLEPTGTVWTGDGDLLVQGRPIGRLVWSFTPVTLFRGQIGYDLSLAGEHIRLDGRATTGTTSAEASIRGQVGGPFVSAWLAAYDIELQGNFQLVDTTMQLTGRRLDDTSGMITWTGGPVTYVLSGRVYRTTLPPIRAELGPGPTAVAIAEGASTPLLHAELKPNGFAKIGVTKYLTKLTGNPWPGGDPDHAVVLEVEEQVF